eukprot:14894829-Alexandrium_andersonii.AAC.2
MTFSRAGVGGSPGQCDSIPGRHKQRTVGARTQYLELHLKGSSTSAGNQRTTQFSHDCVLGPHPHAY